MLTVDEFFAKYPKYEKAKVSDEEIEIYLELAESMISSCLPADKQKKLYGLFVAHGIEASWMQTNVVAGMAGSVAAGGNGANIQSIDDDLTTTHYGRLFLRLRKANKVALPIVF